MKVGSLFSGIGGFDLGFERAGMSIEWQVENNDYCRKVLQKQWPAVPCHYDITKIDWRDIPQVDLVCGGFPCQPFSCAGKQQGKDDDRYLWPEVVRCLAVLRPTWFLGENVYGLLHLGIEQVCADLETLGYQVAVLGIPACAVDAPHIRKRVWIVAYTESPNDREAFAGTGQRSVRQSGVCSLAEDVADTRSPRGERWWEEGICADGNERNTEEEWSESNAEVAGLGEAIPDSSGNGQGAGTTEEWAGSPDVRRWPAEPSICRVVDGVPNRSHRLKGLGNAIIPQIVEALGRMIMAAEGALTDAP